MNCNGHSGRKQSMMKRTGQGGPGECSERGRGQEPAKTTKPGRSFGALYRDRRKTELWKVFLDDHDR